MSVYYFSSSTRHPAIPVAISHAGGFASITMNQAAANVGTFSVVGTFDFAGGMERVTITSPQSGTSLTKVTADAVQWTCVEDGVRTDPTMLTPTLTMTAPTMAATTMAPATVEPTTMAATTMVPATVEPTTMRPPAATCGLNSLITVDNDATPLNVTFSPLSIWGVSTNTKAFGGSLRFIDASLVGDATFRTTIPFPGSHLLVGVTFIPRRVV